MNNIEERIKLAANMPHGEFKILALEELGLKFDWPTYKKNTYCYSVFIRDFNSTIVTSHFFENILLKEDRAHEYFGKMDFQIDIPIEYFRFSGKMNEFIGEDEKENIKEIVTTTKSFMNIKKDMNILTNNIAKNEFITIFAIFESYLEGLRVEILKENRETAAKYIRKKDIFEATTETLNAINPEIIEKIDSIEKNFIKYIDFCKFLRNAHTHNLGQLTKYNYNKMLERSYLHHDNIITKTGKIPDESFSRPSFSFISSRCYKPQKYISLKRECQAFRLLIRELVFLTEHYINIKD